MLDAKIYTYGTDEVLNTFGTVNVAEAISKTFNINRRDLPECLSNLKVVNYIDLQEIENATEMTDVAGEPAALPYIVLKEFLEESGRADSLITESCGYLKFTIASIYGATYVYIENTELTRQGAIGLCVFVCK